MITHYNSNSNRKSNSISNGNHHHHNGKISLSPLYYLEIHKQNMQPEKTEISK